ncbi:hypothetical protein LQV05_002841 [Cryptococcus neoformans]|nr:compass component swd1 [Cryptococcus neoformans var. grubii c45]OXB34403.1 compass component swd1 [Cryptococcus neoformans var. grubii]OXC58549.1 compass component swd1 [Cryptococcus neoformans var. grubii MW-RSA852]UOH80192.1 hypothetical protein LQV05_002841 [Cryptococcus neoformans]
MQQLLNPFAQKYPDAVDSTLFTQGVCLAFNRSGPFAGHYLAVGNSHGTVEIWDVETRGVVRILEGHVKAVEGLSWSRNNRYLLSASSDGTAIVWDLSVLPHPLLSPRTPLTNEPHAGSSSARLHTVRFDSPVINASFHPRNSRIILAVLSCGEVVIVDMRKGGGKYRLEDVSDEDETAVNRKRISMTCGDFSPCGSRVYVGTSNGMLVVIDPMTRQILQRAKLANSGIRQLSFDTSGFHLLTSATDRALRLLHIDPLTLSLSPLHRFQDLINRTPWNSIGFSGDAEYVMGGAAHKMAHNVFIWDRESGVLVKVLEGPKEPLIACTWHPTKPIIASITTSGDVHVWQTSSPDNWAAFAPGFEELEENVEYDEREDEFDIEDETELNRRKDLEEDINIDLLTPQEDAFPRRAGPILSLPSNIIFANDDEQLEAMRLIESISTVAKWAEREAAVYEDAVISGDGEQEELGEASNGAADGDDWVGFYLSQDLLSDIRNDEEAGT